MTEPAPGSVWAYVAHKDGKFAGAAAGNLSRASLKEFLGDFAADGFTLTTVFSREEYNKLIDGMPIWRPSKAARR